MRSQTNTLESKFLEVFVGAGLVPARIVRQHDDDHFAAQNPGNHKGCPYKNLNKFTFQCTKVKKAK